MFFQRLPESGKKEMSAADAPCYVREPHPFVSTKLTLPADHPEVQALMANFRAVGRRLRHPNEPMPTDGSFKKPKSEKNGDERGVKAQVDALNPFNHQKLAVLFCSFSSESTNAPAFCVNPW